jgi:PAS domain-containing protein
LKNTSYEGILLIDAEERTEDVNPRMGPILGSSAEAGFWRTLRADRPLARNGRSDSGEGPVISRSM